MLAEYEKTKTPFLLSVDLISSRFLSLFDGMLNKFGVVGGSIPSIDVQLDWLARAMAG